MPATTTDAHAEHELVLTRLIDAPRHKATDQLAALAAAL
jgi:hypothetical protein